MGEKENMLNMFGCESIEEFCSMLEKTFTFRYQGAAFCAMSMMSDAQEQMERGDTEAARKTLNRAKYVLSTYCGK